MMRFHFRLFSACFSHNSNVQRVVLWLTSVASLLVVQAVAAETAKTNLKTVQVQPCKAPTFEFGEMNDMQSLVAYKAAVAGMLKEGRFAELDCLADYERSS